MPPWTVEELNPIGDLRQYRVYRFLPRNPPGSMAVYHWSGWSVHYVQQVLLPSGVTFWCGGCGNGGFGCDHVVAVQTSLAVGVTNG